MRNGRPPTPLAVRFWAKVRKTEGCWIWEGAHGHMGHGRMRDGQSRMVQAAAVSWALNRGPVPVGLCVLHHCDNPPCVHPDHLFLGTKTDNVRDMDAKGRRRPPRGSQHGNARLTEDAVSQMRRLRADGWTFRKLAEGFGVSAMTAHRAVTGRGWRHAA